MTESKIIEIDIKRIYPHPNNPRKAIGDITELVESIKKNGIMQNLTIIPISALDNEPDKQPGAQEISELSDFHALIGHRRHAASLEAGLTKVPCKIVSNISLKEQVEIMLGENMQRNDLTIYEQAQGFQMLLDLGETEETIAEKTGFSRTTVRHRLNIAKLNQDTLEKKESNGDFQLRLTDLYELEKVEDIKERDRILKEASSSRDIIWKVQRALKEAEEKKKKKEILSLLKPLGIAPAPKDVGRYTSGWEVVKEFEYSKKIPKKIDIKQGKDSLFYCEYWNGICVIRKLTKAEVKESPEKVRDRNKKKIKSVIQQMNTRRREFVQCIVDGTIEPVKDEAETKDAIFNILLEFRAYVSLFDVQQLFTDKYEYQLTPEEKEELDRKAKAVSVIHKMLIVLNRAMMAADDIYDNQGCYKPEIGSRLLKGYSILEKYGWSFETDEEIKVLDGTHELYEAGKK